MFTDRVPVRYLALGPIILLLYFLVHLGLDAKYWPSPRSELAEYRQEHNSAVWYHVDEVWGHSWQTDTLKEREDILFDGLRRFIRTRRHARSNLLFLVLAEDESSWGAENFAPERKFEDFLSLLDQTGVELSRASLGIMTSSESEYNRYRDVTLSSNLGRVTILLKTSHEPQDENLFTSRPRLGRHSKEFQSVRRANLALLRNELQTRTLQDERHIVWIDSDVKYFSPNIVQTMIHHSDTKPDASIITSLCNTSYWPDYDKNAFQGARPPPAAYRLAQQNLAEEEAQASWKHVGQLVQETDDELVPLDAVGATILYIRASLVHQGLTFPPYYVMGAGWGRDGWDGIETMGLCYVARYLRGGGCWTLGRDYYVEHTRH